MISPQQFLDFIKRLLNLEGRVGKNTEEIAALRQDLKTLTEFTQRVAYAVRSNRERQESAYELLVVKLENELLKLENRLGSTRQIQSESPPAPKRLVESNGKVELP